MVYEYSTIVDFPLTENSNGWYVAEDAVKKMVHYYNTHYGCKAPVIIEKETKQNNIVGTVNSNEKLTIEHHSKNKCSIKLPVLLRTDFNPNQFYQAVDLCNVKTNPNNPNELISFRIKNVVAISKEE